MLRPLFIASFWIASAFSLVMALLPQPPHLPGDPSDKLLHVTAFATLATLGALAYPRTPLIRLGLMLALFGMLIEILQLIPRLHRDASLIDWIADTAAVAVVLLMAWQIRMRRA